MTSLLRISMILIFLTSSLVFVIYQSCDTAHVSDRLNPVERMYDLNEWRHRPFDSEWKFYRGEAEEAEKPEFNDSDWRVLDLPHDWSIEDLPDEADTFPDLDPPRVGPFTPASPGGLYNGFTFGGTGWYRKSFELDTDDLNKQVYIRFDGVYMNADVWVNGHHLGNHPYGYTAFYFDMTPHLKPAGETNIIAVQVKNHGRNSRWYSGSGIYRHVWLDVVDKIHIKTWGVGITTDSITANSATINLVSTVKNNSDEDKDIVLETTIIDPDGNESGTYIANGRIPSDDHSAIKQKINIDNAKLWSMDSPDLYLARVSVRIDDIPVDIYVSTFGIRSLEFSASEGFKLNGEKVLLRGGNMHHDNGPLGSATIDRAEYRRVELMKSNGYNAIRTSHNPPSAQFLDACDLMGIVVIDEAFDMWQRPKNPQDYSLFFDDWWRYDLESMVLRDRNHPSVIMWSIGNEINERADSIGLELTASMYDVIKEIDPSRPVTAGICAFWDHPGRQWEATAPAFQLLDIGGYNYQWRRYNTDHEKYPDRIMAGTESVAMEAYDNWKAVEDNSYVIGDFIWTAMDYIGEASIGHSIIAEEESDDFLLSWPWFNAWCGDIDLCGLKKPQSYYRDVVWGISQIEMMVHQPVPEGKIEDISFWGWPLEEKSWNWNVAAGMPLEVAVYSRLDSVGLFLNGDAVGNKISKDTMSLKSAFEVPYEPGKLLAIGYKEGVPIDSSVIVTAGSPTQLRLTADRNPIKANRNDLCYITVEICDSKGYVVPDAEINLKFRISGEGELTAVGNGNPRDIKSFQSSEVNTFRGRCLVIARPKGESGEIQVTAEASGFDPESIMIEVSKDAD